MMYQKPLTVIVPGISNNKIIVIPLVWFLLLFALISHSSAEEKILQFHSDITINEDSTMTVCETIKVLSENREIRRGIYRDFPTHYKGRLGIDQHVVGFDVLSVTRDGETENYFIKTMSNGKRVYIGKQEVFILPGEHTFTVLYKTDRQLGFFEDHDELYWNVTGNGWIFPIEGASATVYLPANIPREAIQTNGYTGLFGAKETNFYSWLDDAGNVRFITTESLRKYHGLTIVVSWPKGFIKPPNFLMKLQHFIRDAKVLLIAVLGILVLLSYYLVMWSQVGKDPKRGVIMPIYTPPLGLSPAALRYILKMGYHEKVFAAALINLAVNDYLEIAEHSEYTLKKDPERVKV